MGWVSAELWCGGEVVWRRGAPGQVVASRPAAKTFGPKRSIALLFRDEAWKPKHNLSLHKQGWATRSRLEADHGEIKGAVAEMRGATSATDHIDMQ